jgi:hypothetical protein
LPSTLSLAAASGSANGTGRFSRIGPWVSISA